MSDIVAEAAPDAPQEAGATAPGEIGMSMSATDTAQPADAGISDSNTAGQAEVPNAVPVAVESTTAPDSAPSAAGGDTTSLIAANSAEPLPARIAVHLEAIYSLVREHTDALAKLV